MQVHTPKFKSPFRLEKNQKELMELFESGDYTKSDLARKYGITRQALGNAITRYTKS